MFKVGDKVAVLFDISNGNWNWVGATYGEVLGTGISPNKDLTLLHPLDSKREKDRTLNEIYVYTKCLVPLEIYNSPLFKAMQEEE